MLCYYITGHGFGHAIRTVQILKALPPDLPLILKTTAPERLFREELPGRDFRIQYSCRIRLRLPAKRQCHCAAARNVDPLRSRSHSVMQSDCRRRSRFCKQRGVRCVASDVPSFPLYAAQQAGIPSVAVANFTWHDIYSEYVETADDAKLLAGMAEEYAAASVACITPLNVSSVADVFSRVEHVPHCRAPRQAGSRGAEAVTGNCQ